MAETARSQKRHTLRRWGFVHKWTSLICTVFMLLLCITGLPLVFHEEIRHLSYPVAHDDTTISQPPSIDALVAAARAARSNEVVPFLFFDDDDPIVTIGSAPSLRSPPDQFFYQVFDLHSGKRLDLPQPNQGFMHVMLRLHSDMYAGLPGMLFLGFMGLLLTISIISGTVLYGPFMRRLPFGTVRSTQYARWLDIHNLLGIVTLVWFTVVGFTGVINTLGQPIEMYWQSTQLAEMAKAKSSATSSDGTLASVDKVITAVQHAAPDMRVRTVAFPGSPFASPHHYTVFLVGNTAITSRLLKPALVDAVTGELTDMREMPLYAKILFVSQPLHFGDYGGIPFKTLWGILDVITIVVLVTGLYLWLKKRKRSTERLDDMEPATS